MKNKSLWMPGCGIFKNIRWFVERATRGWSDADAWSIDGYLNNLLPDLIRSLKGGVGCPGDMYDKTKKNNECWKWDEILESIAQGFEAAQELGELKYITRTPEAMRVDEKRRKNLIAKYHKGMDLFRKYYMSLWD